MCVVTGRHMVLDDWCFCPVSKCPALYSEYVKYIEVRVCVCVCVCVCVFVSFSLTLSANVFIFSVSASQSLSLRLSLCLSLSISSNILLPPPFLSHITSQHIADHFYGRLKFKLPRQHRRTHQRRKDPQGTKSQTSPHPLQPLTLCWVDRSPHWTLKYVRRMWQQRTLRSITML